MNNITSKQYIASILSVIFLVFYLFHAPALPHLDHYPMLEQTHPQELIEIEHMSFVNENNDEWIYDKKRGIFIQV